MNRIYIFLVSLLFVCCGASSGKQQNAKSGQPQKAPTVVEPAVIVPIFDADSAYNFIEAQVNFGPRVPSTPSHRKCGDYLVSKFESYGATVLTQDVDLRAYNGDLLKARNIIAQFNPEKSDRIMLCAHWIPVHGLTATPTKPITISPCPVQTTVAVELACCSK